LMRRETVFNRVWTRFVCETAFQRIDFAFRVYMGNDVTKTMNKQFSPSPLHHLQSVIGPHQ
jgi:hypothetical protein